MSFGEKLQMLRKKKGISQEQLAQQLDVSRQAISKWETGESLPETEKVILLAKFFDVTIDYLLCKQPGQESGPEEIQTGQEKATNHWFDRTLKWVKRKGYIAGFIISLYGFLALLLTRFAHFSFKSMLLPEGFDVSLADLPSEAKIPLYFSDALSIFALIIIVFGLGLAFYLKKTK